MNNELAAVANMANTMRMLSVSRIESFCLLYLFQIKKAIVRAVSNAVAMQAHLPVSQFGCVASL